MLSKNNQNRRDNSVLDGMVYQKFRLIKFSSDGLYSNWRLIRSVSLIHFTAKRIEIDSNKPSLKQGVPKRSNNNSYLCNRYLPISLTVNEVYVPWFTIQLTRA